MFWQLLVATEIFLLLVVFAAGFFGTFSLLLLSEDVFGFAER